MHYAFWEEPKVAICDVVLLDVMLLNATFLDVLVRHRLVR